MIEVIEFIEDVSLRVVAIVLFSEFFIFTAVSVIFSKITAHAFKDIADSVEKLDECVKTIGAELDDVSDSLHDLKDHK
jgi:hypothetical protein